MVTDIDVKALEAFWLNLKIDEAKTEAEEHLRILQWLHYLFELTAKRPPHDRREFEKFLEMGLEEWGVFATEPEWLVYEKELS